MSAIIKVKYSCIKNVIRREKLNGVTHCKFFMFYILKHYRLDEQR